MKREKKNKALGCAPSKLDGSEYIYNAPETLGIPEEYDYREFMSKILDQGNDPICVPCSLSTWVNWRINMNDGSKTDHKVNLKQIFKGAGGNAGGMTFKAALSFLRHKGVETNVGDIKIGEYALIKNIVSLKDAIITNGPCFGALPVYDDSGYDKFWDRTRGYLKGGHAIAIVGWTKDGFIIRNSWGTSFGEKGYVVISFKQFSTFLELWTILR
mgnify:CR=1 FL=1